MQQVCLPAHCTVHELYGQHPTTLQAGGLKPLLTQPPKHEFCRAWLAALHGQLEQRASMLCGQSSTLLSPGGCTTSTAHTNAAVPPQVMRLRPRVNTLDSTQAANPNSDPASELLPYDYQKRHHGSKHDDASKHNYRLLLPALQCTAAIRTAYSKHTIQATLTHTCIDQRAVRLTHFTTHHCPPNGTPPKSQPDTTQPCAKNKRRIRRNKL